MLERTKTLLPWPLPRPRIILCAWWTSLNMSFCTARNWTLREHSEGSGDTRTSQADGKNPLLPVSEIWSPSWVSPLGTFLLICAGQGRYKCVEGEQGWALQAGQVSKPSWLKWSLDNAATPVKWRFFFCFGFQTSSLRSRNAWEANQQCVCSLCTCSLPKRESAKPGVHSVLANS